MKRWILATGILVASGAMAAQEAGTPKPQVFRAECAGGDCVLMKGAPQTGGMRGGSVKLGPKESVGWHSTNESEEALTILHGSGVAHIEGGADVALGENTIAYIPPRTRHDVTNTGGTPLEYVWIVAPLRK